MAFPRNNPRVHKMVEQQDEIKWLNDRIAALERKNAGLRAALEDALEPLDQVDEAIANAQAHIAASERENAELLEALEDVTHQACADVTGTELDAGCLSANAHAIRVLAKHGRVKITSEYGRSVRAKYLAQTEKGMRTFTTAKEANNDAKEQRTDEKRADPD